MPPGGGQGEDDVGPGEDPEHPWWVADATIPFAHDEHQKHGLWAIDTGNPNGWGSAQGMMDKSRADVIVAQEMKKRGWAARDGAEADARARKWSASISEAGEADMGGGPLAVPWWRRGLTSASRALTTLTWWRGRSMRRDST